VPRSTENRIKALCARIRTLSRGDLTPLREAELRRLAIDLRSAIGSHLHAAKSSLSTKKLAIEARDASDDHRK
jgi:hypothetical protein